MQTSRSWTIESVQLAGTEDFSEKVVSNEVTQVGQRKLIKQYSVKNNTRTLIVCFPTDTIIVSLENELNIVIENRRYLLVRKNEWATLPANEAMFLMNPLVDNDGGTTFQTIQLLPPSVPEYTVLEYIWTNANFAANNLVPKPREQLDEYLAKYFGQAAGTGGKGLKSE